MTLTSGIPAHLNGGINSARRPILSIRDLSLHFDGGTTKALDCLDLDIQEGDFVAITGPSGCGKSSLLNLIGSLERPTAGELFFRGTAYSSMGNLAKFRRNSLGFVFQSFQLIPTLTALDNILVPTIGADEASAGTVARARSLMEQMGLQNRLGHFPPQLSGGERQRVAIARALINRPELILADEPTGSLDSVNAVQVLDLLERLQGEYALTIIMVTHDASVSARAHRIIRMRDGRVDSDEGGVP